MRISKKTEHSEQVALFDWAKKNESRHLQLGLMFSIPNQGGKGKAAVVRGIKMVKEGLKAGVPDIFLSVPKNGKHGLFIELKVGQNKPTSNQNWWIYSLRAEGYAVEICYGFEQAKAAIINYLGLETE